MAALLQFPRCARSDRRVALARRSAYAVWLRPVASGLDRSCIRHPACADAGARRLRGRYVGPASGSHSVDTPGARAPARTLHRSGGGALRPRRAAGGDGERHPRLPGNVMRITHGRIELELHELARRDGPRLLLLHTCSGSSEDWGEAPAAWPGSVYALDFTGHGRSDWLVGGGYYPELLAADADVALTHTGPVVIAGAGLGA